MTKPREVSQFANFIYVDDSNGRIGIATTASPNIGIGTTNPTSKLSVIGDVYVSGNIGVGTTNPTYSLHVIGSASATSFTSLSDKNKKKNIIPIENALSIIKQLQGVRYNWIENDIPSIGVIAQEIEKVLPEVVNTSSDGTKSVSYGNIIGLLIEAIKEQQTRIEELEKKINI
jgi:hypothetical protein